MTQLSSAGSPPINLALFGAGRWGTHLLRNFLAHPHIRLRVVVEASQARLNSLASELPDSVILTSNWQEAMKLSGLEACAIATPAATHYELIQAALNHNLHVLAEKPLTLDTASSTALCDLAEKKQCQLVIDHTYLFHSAVNAGKRAISGIGQPRYGYAARTHLGPVRQDVDALWDLAIHDISIFNHWLGETPAHVQAQGSSWLQPHIQTALSPNGLGDVVWCRLQYPSGFQATIHLCWANPDKQRRLCIVGNSATLVFDEINQENPLTLRQGRFVEKDGCFLPESINSQPIHLSETEPLKELCDHFVDCLKEGTQSPISSGQVGTRLVSVLAGLSQSMHSEGGWVSVVT